MFFNSYAFIFCFLPLFLVAWQLSATSKATPNSLLWLLLFFSVGFYAFWGIPFLLLLLATILINFAFGQFLASPENNSGNGNHSRRKALFIVALIVNLIPLLWFKYSWFIVRNLAIMLDTQWEFTPPALPPGISFYTFIQIAWLVGVYQRKFIPGKLSHHMLFCSCFAYVLSGPIIRQEQVAPQIGVLAGINSINMAEGLTLFTIGLAKKVILADSIGIYADAVFNAAEKAWPISCLEAWLGSFCYTFQLYFDFSGYTDMALGLALMVGLRLPENFSSPYKSTGIVDFWRRWHITLGTWLRDFLYIPLGGNRHGKIRQYCNLFFTMLIGGLWHGAGWTFIIWGALHGLMLGINHFFRSVVKGTRIEAINNTWVVRLFFILLTFFCLNMCWVVFRAFSLDGAVAMYRAMFPFGPEAAQNVADWQEMIFSLNLPEACSTLFPNRYFTGWHPFVLTLICAALCWFFPNSHEMLYGRTDGSIPWLCWRPARRWAIALSLLAFISLIFLSRQTTFLYFQF